MVAGPERFLQTREKEASAGHQGVAALVEGVVSAPGVLTAGVVAVPFIVHIGDELEEVVADLGLHRAAAQLPTSCVFSKRVRRVVLSAAYCKEQAGVDKWVAGRAELGDVVAARIVLTELAALC